MLKRTLGEKIFNVFNFIFFFLISLLMLIPVAFILKSSLETTMSGELNISLLPKQPSFIYFTC
jgi:hypothetical protein